MRLRSKHILYGQQTLKHQQAAARFSLISFSLADSAEINNK
jgi:hypothetical protein